MVGWLRRARERAPDPQVPPPGWEVLPEDWVAAGDSLRRMLGLAPYQGRARYPTVEEMEEWERAFPGSASWWRRCARLESERRYRCRL